MMHTYENLLDQGDAFLQQQQIAAAVHAFGLAAELAPDRKEALMQLGLICKDMGDHQGAVGFFSRAHALDARDAFSRLSLGITLYEMGALEKASEHLQAANTLISESLVETRAFAEADGHEQSEQILFQCDELEQTVYLTYELLGEIASQMEQQQAA